MDDGEGGAIGGGGRVNDMKRQLIALAIVGVLSVTVMPSATHAYSYAGMRWPSTYPNVTVTIDNSTIPTQWNSAFTSAMSAWNNAGSRMRFSNYVGGSHTVSLKFAWFAPWLALTTTSYTGSTIFDCKTVFNNRYSWDVNGAWNKYDAWSVMTHEFGHWITLNDLYGSGDREKTMYGSGLPGEVRQRSLDIDDVNGIRSVYGVR